MLTIFSMITAGLNALPWFKKFFDLFYVYYAQTQLEKMEKENANAIRKIILELDQREAEKALGSSSAGKFDGTGVVTDAEWLRNKTTD